MVNLQILIFQKLRKERENENRLQQVNWHNNNPPPIGGSGSSGTS